MVVNLLRSIQNTRRDDRGFTLAEIMITIVIMGILAGIAIPSFLSVVQGRAVDSAANQLAADLRLENTRGTSRLATWRVVLTSSGAHTYQIDESSGLSNRDFCGDNGCDNNDPKVTFTGGSPSFTIAFCADGTAELPATSPVCPNGTASPAASGTKTFTVSAGGASTDIQVNKATSRVNVP